MANAASTDIYADSTCVFTDDTADCETSSVPGTRGSPMGCGFFMFFQTEIEHHSWADKVDTGKKQREEQEILILLSTMFEVGIFD